MKLSKITLLVSLLCLFLAGCTSKSPEAVAIEFYKAYYRADFKKMRSLCTPETKEGVDIASSMMKEDKIKEMKASKVKLEVVSCEIDKERDIAEVVLKIINEESEVEKKETTYLKKENGQWLIVFNLK